MGGGGLSPLSAMIFFLIFFALSLSRLKGRHGPTMAFLKLGEGKKPYHAPQDSI